MLCKGKDYSQYPRGEKMKRRPLQYLLTVIAAMLFLGAAYPRFEVKAIVLTFDDGPRCEFLPELLKFLEQEKLPAAFFFQGWQIKECPDLVRDMAKKYLIENHTYGRGAFAGMLTRGVKKDMTPEQKLEVLKKNKRWILDDVERGTAEIWKVAGRKPRFFRPPHWDMWDREVAGVRGKEPATEKELLMREIGDRMHELHLVQLLDHAGLSYERRVLRDVNTLDYEFHERHKHDPGGAVRALVDGVQKILKARESAGVTIHVLDFHELPVSLEALHILVPQWKKEGYQFWMLTRVWGI